MPPSGVHHTPFQATGRRDKFTTVLPTGRSEYTGLRLPPHKNVAPNTTANEPDNQHHLSAWLFKPSYGFRARAACAAPSCAGPESWGQVIDAPQQGGLLDRYLECQA